MCFHPNLWISSFHSTTMRRTTLPTEPSHRTPGAVAIQTPNTPQRQDENIEGVRRKPNKSDNILDSTPIPIKSHQTDVLLHTTAQPTTHTNNQIQAPLPHLWAPPSQHANTRMTNKRGREKGEDTNHVDIPHQV
jgi:hypothetical protein